MCELGSLNFEFIINFMTVGMSNRKGGFSAIVMPFQSSIVLSMYTSFVMTMTNTVEIAYQTQFVIFFTIRVAKHCLKRYVNSY